MRISVKPLQLFFTTTQVLFRSYLVGVRQGFEWQVFFAEFNEVSLLLDVTVGLTSVGNNYKERFFILRKLKFCEVIGLSRM